MTARSKLMLTVLQMHQSNYISCIHRNDVDSKLMMVKVLAKSDLMYVFTLLRQP